MSTTSPCQRPGNLTAQRIAANVQHRSGLSAIKGDAEVSIVRASIRIRRRADVNAGMRVLFDGATYDVRLSCPGTLVSTS
nr:phage head closure protein [Staphylococcus epidermidis]